jgi:Tol biopolymer transport system component
VLSRFIACSSLLLLTLTVLPTSVLAEATESEEVEPTDPGLITQIRRLTYEGRRAGEGYFSADGKLMVFQSEREAGNPFYQIYLMDMETGDVERISPGTGKTTCAWIHPDNQHILYASTHDDSAAEQKQADELKIRAEGKERRYSWDYDDNYELYSFNRQTQENQRLTHARGYDAEGSYSSDGKLIAFASNRHIYASELSADDQKKLELDPSYFMEIYAANADGSNVRRLTHTKGYDGGPFFSPDGQRICWRRFSEDGATAEIFTMNIDGSDVRQLTDLGVMSWAPFYHPSNEYLIFTNNKNGFGNFELYLVDIAGAHQPVRACVAEGFDGLPVFSPDGKTISWTSTRGSLSGGQIHIGRWNHAKAQQLLAASPLRGATSTTTQAALPETDAEITSADIRAHVYRLASDEFAGRLTGTPGEQLATQYVADMYKRIGLEPAGDNGSYFQDFDFTAGVALGSNNKLALQVGDDKAEFTVDQDWRPLAFSDDKPVAAAEVVFAGYGLTLPPDADEAYDSFVHADLAGKWVMVLRYLPEDVTPERRQELARVSGLRYKAMQIRDQGAAGMIVVSGPRSGVRDELVRLSFDSSLSGSSIAAISITNELAERILKPTGKSLDALQEKLDTGEHMQALVIPDVKLSASVELKKVHQTGRNVLARLKSNQPNPHPEALVIGAHLDHLGHGNTGSSLATEEERDQIHYGADDNASGVAAMLEIAEYYAQQLADGEFKPRRDMIFAAWSGEELGLLGSAHFTKQLAERDPHKALTGEVCAYLNMDMVGRLEDKLVVQGVGSSKIWPGLIERRNVPIGLPIVMKPDTYLPTDATSFYLNGVPILSAFTGAHGDYHTPRDTPEKLNYEGNRDIARFVGLLAQGLAVSDKSPEYQKTKKPENLGSRSGLRAYLGTIPDYGESPIPGVLLSGVSAGGPAEKAGVQKGDTITALAGRKIENIYDYTYAIDALKIGEPVKMQVRRGEDTVELTIVPGSRE